MPPGGSGKDVEMETERCRTLLKVIEEGSLTAAAEKLGYTVSGISRMMAALEEEAGFPLLIRSRGGVSPTRECRELMPFMMEMVRTAERFDQAAGELCGLSRGTITIGTSYYAYYRWFSGLIAQFTAAHPGVTIKIMEGTSTELIRAVEEQRADLCIISRRPGAVEWIPLTVDSMLACLPEDHPLAEKENFPIRAFAEEDFIELYPGKETDNSRMFEDAGIKPRVKYSTSDNYAAYAMVAAGLGIACTNAIIAEAFTDGVKYLPVSPPRNVEIGIAIPEKRILSPAAERFAAFAKDRALKNRSTCRFSE